ncbi:hypothetical protein GCM10023091_25290 [Ravibacter arvi]|uniref:Anti-sigma factor n=1 Tax=Ravibacter arvi TaxID=2051041 RepID=A0ABP8LZY2_9BACT
MENSQYYTEEFKQRFLLGNLTPREEHAFRKLMRSDPALEEEVEILKAMQRVEIEKFVAARLSDDSEVLKPVAKDHEKRTLPLYRQTWFRAAAAIIMVLGAGWLTWITFGPEKTSLTASIEVRQSVDGSLGWAPDAKEAEQVITIVTRDEAGALRYRYDHDTLKIFTPQSLKSLYDKGKLYLVDDLKNTRLVLVMDGKNYPIESGLTTETPLVEETPSLP